MHILKENINNQGKYSVKVTQKEEDPNQGRVEPQPEPKPYNC
jgi:hypothetical protein